MNTATLTDLINQYGYFGIAALIALENIFPPIPSEVILTFSGFITLSSRLSVIGTIIAATIGAVIGALVLYALGRLLSAKRLERLLAGRTGKLLHLKSSDVARAAAFFKRHGGQAVFFGRFIPLIRSLISLPAGMSGYPLGRFLLFSTLGTLIWNTVLILVGRLAGHAWPHIVTTIEGYGKLLLLIVLLVAVLAFWWYHRQKRKKV
ncbi:DedA family protein [Liquorilactobacillus satsumensis]|uniref:Alkaline phosphatase n=1 Tax=Liquorilactobacillus satsumensis DSM 16230 = JCM 12392 TaxID=1423801 RepID=A0A0R1V6A7_9LACO|nr:DedA family protein [Liquorilactobacillus satsumensis]KRL97275.1 alkaline phosphatase [Liquorilactobacillus satsumensis DSM 16230 = JCM 12392]